METLHKIAGVQDAQRSDAASPLPQPTIVTGITPDPSIPPPPPPKDAEGAQRDPSDAVSIKSRKSTSSRKRASVPLNRRPSHNSFRSGHSKSGGSRNASLYNASRTDLDIPPIPKIVDSQGNHGPQPVVPRGNASAASITQLSQQHPVGEEGEDDYLEDSDFEWGPQHPCFPHPNPYCAPDSDAAMFTRVIRVKRDYLMAGDLYPQFANLYPEILDPLVTDSEFRDLISGINNILMRAFSPYTARAWIDALLGVATGYIWDDLGLTGAKSAEKELERYMSRWNSEREKEGREVKVVQARNTGFMNLDFVVPDPGIDVAVRDEGGITEGGMTAPTEPMSEA